MVDALKVGRAMLHDEVPTVSGPVYSIQDAFNRPQPVQVGGVPVVALLGADRPLPSATIPPWRTRYSWSGDRTGCGR